MDSLTPREPDLFKRGEVVAVCAMEEGAVAFEARIVEIRERLGVPVDWHTAAGRAIVRTWPYYADRVREALGEKI